jgi:hypothetical protein
MRVSPKTINLTTPERIDFANKPIRYAPVGRCIYCGDQHGKLGDEHIVPFAIARNSLVLPEASCRSCETATGRFEQACLRRTMGNIRVRLDAPTRNKKDRKPTLRLRRAKVQHAENGGFYLLSGDADSIDIPSSAVPMFYISLLLDQPGILQELSLGTPLPWNTFYTYKQGDTAESALQPGIAVEVGQFNPYLYAQFLAKMAYAYAVAVDGLTSFRPLVLDLILGRTNYFRHWVGGEPTAPRASENEIHQISRSIQRVGDREFIVVRIRLFSFLGTPVYDVVVGERDVSSG